MKIIQALHQVLNLMKDFTAGYSTKNMDKGLMIVEYEGKRYALKIVEIENPSEKAVNDFDRLEYLV